ncbi:peptidase M20 [Turicimonas muris]|uniref:peptidase M20 n=1 Tax=Turicimonas muris TaxID=1796652 RepID=UPI0023F0B147|nr:peptidase M20 [Turicimonas muris]
MQLKFLAVLVSSAVCSSLALAAVPNVSEATKASAEAINSDPVMQKIKKELETPEAQKWRFNTHMEVVRIASPSRFELRRQEELMRRFVQEWGIDEKNVMSRVGGNLPGAGLQKVDGLPVYNACVRIPGTYSQTAGAQTYAGQGPKVLLEGHIDTVNPPVLPPKDKPYMPIKLQKADSPLVKTPQELAAIPDELHFDKNGKIIEDENYQKAYKRYASLDDAIAKGGYRLYVPGYNDAMINTAAVMQIAQILTKYKVKPVYDLWVCGTAGEEGKGNLAGMKQLYGYSQDTGKGNNALNFVANISADSTRPGSGAVNYLGSYRFEIKYIEPKGVKAGAQQPSALMAMNRAVAAIADLKTPYDLDKKAERTTYTVGVGECTKAPEGGRSEECTLMVDMRSPTPEPLLAIRSKIEPKFQEAMDAENAKFGLKKGDPKAVKMELVWFGDRPAHRRTNYDDPVVQIHWQAADTVGIDQRKALAEGASSLNDNVPAAVGVPTININVGTPAAGGGGHTWYEWGIPGDGRAEGNRVYRMILMGLMAAGYNTADGKVVKPLLDPMGKRTTEEVYK